MIQTLDLPRVVQTHSVQFVSGFGCDAGHADGKVFYIVGDAVSKNGITSQFPLRLLPVGAFSASVIVFFAMQIDLVGFLLNVFDCRVQRIAFRSDPPLIHVQEPTALAKPIL